MNYLLSLILCWLMLSTVPASATTYEFAGAFAGGGIATGDFTYEQGMAGWDFMLTGGPVVARYPDVTVASTVFTPDNSTATWCEGACLFGSLTTTLLTLTNTQGFRLQLAFEPDWGLRQGRYDTPCPWNCFTALFQTGSAVPRAVPEPSTLWLLALALPLLTPWWRLPR